MKRGIMKREIITAILLTFAIAASASAQYGGGYADRATLTIKATNPSGACTGAKLWINSTTGDAFACYSGIWNTFGGGASFPLLAPDGSAGAPSYSFSAVPTTGIFKSISGVLHFGVAGSSRMSLSTTGVSFPNFSGNTNMIPVFDLSDVASNTFLSFTNVATPANVITMAQDSSEPSLTFTIAAEGTTAQPRFFMDGDELEQSFVAPVVTNSVFELKDTGSNDIFRFVNVAAPAKVISFHQNSEEPELVLRAADGTNLSTVTLRPRGLSSPYIFAGVASAATITPFGNVFHVTGTTTINTITATLAGTCYTLIFDDVLTVGDLTGNINLSAAFITTANDTLTLCCDGTTWFETGRSVN